MKFLIDKLYKLGVRLEVKDNDLKIKAPQGVLTSSHIKEIKKYKEDLITLLSSQVTSKIPKTPKQKYYPLTSAQKRIWMLSQFENANKAYNIEIAYKMEGVLNMEALENAFLYVIRRHESLRTSFVQKDGEVFQQIIPPNNISFSIEHVDHTHDDSIDISQFCEFDLDLTVAPLLGAQLIKLSETNHILVCALHHSIGDGWSIEIFSRELVISYNAYYKKHTIKLPELTIQYTDYSVWINSLSIEKNHKKAEQFWVQKFQGELPKLNLPSLKKRPPIKTYNGKTIHFKFSNEFYNDIIQFSKDQGVTLFATLLTGINAFLYRYTDEDDIILGTPVAGREHPDLQNQIGLFINTIAIRTQILSDDSFKTLLNREKDNLFEAYEHQIYPFDELINKLNLKRDISRSALFDIMVVLQSQTQLDTVATDNFFEGLETCSYQIDSNMAMFDLSFMFVETDSLKLTLNYNSDVYESSFIGKLLLHFENFMQKIITHNLSTPIRKINFLLEKDQEQLEIYNKTDLSYPKHKTLIDLFEDQAKQTPDVVAVNFEENKLTYQQLHEKSNQLAYYIKEKYDTHPDDLIGVLLDRNEWLIISILAILKSGAAYVPMTLDYPQSRIDYILNDTRCKAVIDKEELTIFLKKASTFENKTLQHLTKPENLAYVIYTSGTTGNPKGVMITHKNCVNFISYYSMEVHNTSLTCKAIFDVSVMEIFTALTSGSTLFIAKEETTFNPDAYAKFLYNNRISHCYIHPMHVPQIAKTLSIYEDTYLKRIIIGVEPIKPEAVTWYLSNNIKVINAYGPTETTIYATAYEVKSIENILTANIPVGKPIANYQVFIIDSLYNTLQPDGVIGELCISGDGVGKGYLNAPELNAEKFIAHPFIKGETLYKTGDLVRKLPDGNIEFMGRDDRQIKIRGHRIELGEIEVALTKNLPIEVAYVDIQLHKKEKHLVAYYRSDEKLNKEHIREHLQEKIPYYMLPSFFVQISKFPITINGKIDRKKLPEVNLEDMVQAEYVAPKNIIQEKLIKIWNDVLETEQIGITNNFFELGGHSMKAMKLVNQINTEFGSDLHMRDVFLFPTIISISDQISNNDRKVILSAETKLNYSLSNIQQRIWVESQIPEGSIAYHMPFVIELPEKYQINVLYEAVNRIIKRHEILRTVFRKDEKADVKQWILNPKDVTHSYDFFDYSENDQATSLVNEYIKVENTTLFNLEEGPLLHYALFHIPQNKSIFYLKQHHIISDGWSIQLLLKELFECYEAIKNNKVHEFPPLSLQYKDYSEWERKIISGLTLKEHEKFWEEKLLGELPLIDLPRTKIRPKIKTYSGKVLETSLSESSSKLLQSFSKFNEGSLFITLLSCWKVLLHKYTGLEDIIIGSPVAVRKSKELENQIGPYINTIVLRDTISPHKNFEEIFSVIKFNTLEAFKYGEYPLDILLKKMNIERVRGRSPIFDILFTSQNLQSAIVDNSIPSEDEIVSKDNVKSKFDLNLSHYESNNKIVLRLNFNPDIYEETTIKQLLHHFKALIPKLITSKHLPISEISILSEFEQQLYIEASQLKEVEINLNDSIVSSFQNIVKNYPENIALETPHTKITYKELDILSNQFSQYLKKQHIIVAGDGIVVKLEKDEWFFITIISILKMGCFFIPVDLDFPEKRIAYITKNSKSKTCVDNTIISKFKNNQNDYLKDFEVEELQSNTTCYSIYTSGTTGRPKGVLITHEAVLNYSNWFIKTNAITSKDSSIVLSSLAFDLIYTSVFPCLLSGATIFVPKTSQTKNIPDITSFIKNHQITYIKVTPSYLNVFLDISQNILTHDSKLKLIVSGGESPILSDIEKIVNAGIPVLNHYGPTEATIGSCTHLITQENLDTFLQNPVIGKPIYGSYIYVLNTELQMVPNGVIGELFIGGNGLAKGYVTQEETHLKFISDPFRTAKKIYKTGDYGKILPDGTIQFLGRKDKQLKINGYRIETQEIKNLLVNHKAIINAHITVVENDGRQYLIAFVLGTIVNISDLKEYLRQYLPEYMLPRQFYLLDQFPINKNGKIIEKELLKSIKIGQENTTEYVPPSSENEKLLVDVWEEVLGVENIGIKDVFFELGGDSIKAIQILSRVGEKGLTFDLTDILKYPTIEQLGSFVRMKKRKIPQNKVLGEVSLSPIQLRFINNEKDIPHFFNYSFLYESKQPLEKPKVKKAFEILSAHHDILRAQFLNIDSDWKQTIQDNVTYDFYEFENVEQNFVLEKMQYVQERIKVTDTLIGIALFKNHQKSLLFFSFHHLIIDIISWYTIKEDFENVYLNLNDDKAIVLPKKTDSYLYWVNQQLEKTKTERFQKDVEYWEQFSEDLHTPLFKNTDQLVNTFENQQVSTFKFSEEETLMFQEFPQKIYNINIEEILVIAFLDAFSKTFDSEEILIDIESHGRHETLDNIDISRTVGWFTSIYPVQLHVYKKLSKRIVHTKETLRKVPNKGVSFGMHKYLSKSSKKLVKPQLRINYIGNIDSSTTENGFLVMKPGVNPISKKRTRDYIIDIQARIQDGKLYVQCYYPKHFFSESKITTLLSNYEEQCYAIISHCRTFERQKYTPSDFTFSDFCIPEMEDSEIFVNDNVVDVLPMSLLQKGIFYHYKINKTSKAYFEQKNFRLKGNFIADKVEEAFQVVLNKYSILRTSFTDDIGGDLLQVVKGYQKLNFKYHDMSRLSEEDRKETLETIKKKDIENGFDIENDILIRLHLFKLNDTVFEFCLSHHHILFDGWCNSIIFNDFFRAYVQLLNNNRIDIGTEIPFSNYINWLTKRDNSKAVTYWKQLLSDYDQGVKVPYKKNILIEDVSKSHNRYSFHISEEETVALQHLANKYRITLNTLISGIWGMLLAKYNDTKDVVFGAVVSGRPGELQHVENMVGLFINTIPVRIRFEDDSFENVVKNHQQFWIDSQEHHYLQLSEIQANSHLKDRLINHLYVFENYPSLNSLNENKKNLDFEFLDFDVYEQSNYNFAFIITPGTELHFGFSFDANLFETSDLQKIELHLKNCIQQIIKDPTLSLSKIDIVTPQEKQLLLSEFKGLQNELETEDTLVSLISNYAITLPNQYAVIDSEGILTYSELDKLSSKISNYLIKSNISKETNIGILYHKSTTYIALILGILKAGCSYVPIDVKWPLKRKKEVLNQAEIPLVFISASEIAIVNKLQWECPTLQTYVCMDTKEPYTVVEKESPLMSEELWNHIATTATDEIEAGGWVSSFTGTPFSELEMKEYSENILYKIRPYLNKRKRVLEIGCASGITMFTIAPHVKEYVGLDISSEVINKNIDKIKREGIHNVSCFVKSASEIDSLNLGTFDIIIINSVIQCFPGLNYLRDILKKSCRIISKDGILFLGDIMNQELKQTMLNDLMIYRQEHKNSKAKIVFDTELFVAPNFFIDFAIQNEIQTSPVVSAKKHSISNELTKYRYDVIFELKTLQEATVKSPFKYQYGKDVIEKQSSESVNREVNALTSAYMIFTSGTTGKSKGVSVTHKSIINTLKWRERVYSFSHEDCILSIPSFHFDASVEDIFGALISGATLCIPDQNKILDTDYLSNYIEDKKITNFIAVPTFYEVILEDLQNKSHHLKTVTVAGEVLTQTVLDKHFSKLPDVKLFNEYGPTETSVCATYKEMKSSSDISIGKPIDNMEILILDKNNKLLPIGIVGEIAIGGVGVSLGYYNDAEKTSQKFITHPYKNNEIIYKTGDLGKWLPNSELEFLGRNDHQVKIRGFRVELTEIEAVLETHLLIRKAVVSNNDDRLMAFVELSEELSLDVEDILAYTKNQLPSYMIPTKIEVIDEIPLTPNNKIDRKRIKNLSQKKDKNEVINLPETEKEKALASVWKEVLRTTKDISLDDNFYELGGDSIKSMLVVSKLKKLKYHISITKVLTAPTLKEQVLQLERKNKSSSNHKVDVKSKLLPIQAEFVDRYGGIPSQFNLAVSLINKDIDDRWFPDEVQRLLEILIQQHDALQQIFKKENDDWYMFYDKTIHVEKPLYFDYREGKGSLEKMNTEATSKLHKTFDVHEGPLIKAAIFDFDDESRLVIVIHHFVVDAISWRILIKDILKLKALQIEGQELKLEEKKYPYSNWVKQLKLYGESYIFQKEFSYWQEVSEQKTSQIVPNFPDGDCSASHQNSIALTLSKVQTETLLIEANKIYACRTDDIILTVLSIALQKVFNANNTKIHMESHGRAELIEDIDVNETVGWFTCKYPILLTPQHNLEQTLVHTKEVLRKVPNLGIGYSIYNDLMKPKSVREEIVIMYNNLGSFDTKSEQMSYNKITVSQDYTGVGMSEDTPIAYDLYIRNVTVNGEIQITINFNTTRFHNETINKLKMCIFESLEELISLFERTEDTVITPSDLGKNDLSLDEFEALF